MPVFTPANFRPRFHRFFGWWTREKMLASKFFAVRLAHDNAGCLAALADHNGPVIGCCNHVSWWDPIVMVYLHQRHLRLHGEPYGRTMRAPAENVSLNRFKMLQWIGGFGIDPDDLASLAIMGDYLAEYFATDPKPTVWINPQGRFVDVREPVRARPGAAAVAAAACRAGHDVRMVAVHFEYPMWVDPRPEVLIRLEPIETPDPQHAGTTTRWHRALQTAMTTNQKALTRYAVSRNPDNFTIEVGGRAQHGNPLYAFYLRLRGRHGSIFDRRDCLELTDEPNDTPTPAAVAPKAPTNGAATPAPSAANGPDSAGLA